MNMWAFLLLALSVCTWFVVGEQDRADCAAPACTSATVPDAEAPLPTRPYAAFVDLAGQLHLLRRDAMGRISESVWGPNVTLVDGTAHAPVRAADGRAVSGGGEHDYVLGPAGGVIRGPRLSFGGEQASVGLGFLLPARDGAARATPRGRYRVLGHRCGAGASDCRPLTGTLTLLADGGLAYRAADGEPALEDRLDPAADEAGWTTRQGGRLIADAGGELLVYTAALPAGGPRLVLHGVREDVLAIDGDPASPRRRAWASIAGEARLELPLPAGEAPSPGPGMAPGEQAPALLRPGPGETRAALPPGGDGARADPQSTLASVSGVVVRWLPDRGLALGAPY